jgi:predicted metalloprotease
MRWQGNRQSDNVEDARDDSPDGGGRQGFSIGGGGLSLGTVAIALVASYFLGINPMTVLSMLSGGGGMVGNPSPSQSSHQPGQGASRVHPPGEDQKVQFVATVLADTEDVWGEIFQQAGGRYENPKLKIFRNGTPTACGQGETAMGPFYCPADHKVYIDLAFYDTLRDRLGAPGEFAQAYVIAHEVGHHVQNLMGTSAKLDQARGRVSKAQYNALSVRLELQADCYAGLWANHAQRSRQIIEAGDIESALNAAAQIGDDTLQRKSQGQVVPESFTHGTSQQRVSWFKRGYDTGDINQCNTFTKNPV